MWAAVIRKCLTICLLENLLNLIIKIVFDWWLTSWLINSWLQLYVKSFKILIPASVLSESSSRMFAANFFDCIFLCSHSWTRAFLRRSAWCPGMRKASWLWPTLTWSAALTVPSRSCSPRLPALCSALFGPGVGLPRPGAHNCTTEQDQAHGDDISMAKAAGQGSSWTSVTYTDPVIPGSLFLKCIFF